jgi:type IX secretion system substrate protein
MKRLILKSMAFIYLMAMPFLIKAQDTPYFSKVYDFGGIWDYASELNVYKDSLIIVQGNAFDTTRNILIARNVLFRLDWHGNIIWKRFIKDTSYQYNVYSGRAFDVSNDQIIIPSQWWGTNDIHSSLTAFTINGDSLWQQKYYGDELEIEAVLGNRLGYIVTGTERDSITKYDIFLMQVDSFGKKLWKKRFKWNGNDLSRNLALAPDGGILVGAHSDTFTTKKVFYGNPLVIKTDSLGNIEWMRDFGGPNSPWSEPTAYVKVTTDSFILMASGYSFKDPNLWGWELSRGIIAKMNMQGDIIWQNFYGKTGERTKLADIIETKSGDYVAVGTHINYRNEPFGWMIKVDTAGNLLWERFHTKYQMLRTAHYFSKVGELNDGSLITGNMVIASLYTDGRQQDIWVVRTDSLGCWFAGCDTVCVDPPEITYELERVNDTLFRLRDATKDKIMFSLGLEEIGVGWVSTITDSVLEFAISGSEGWLVVDVYVQNACNLWSEVHDTIYIKPLGINGPQIPEKILLYPNPFTQTLQIRFEQPTERDLQLQIIDISGRMLLQKAIPAGSQRQNVNTSGLPPGIYLYRIGNDETGWQTGKVVKAVSGF